MMKFLQEVKSLANALSLVRKPLSLEFNAIIYHGLGKKYHPIVDVLSICKETITFHELYGSLITHKILVKSTKTLLPVANLA